MSELKPCPMCDGAAHLTKGYATEDVWPHGEFHRVFCGACQIRQLFHRTAAEAVKAWNHRAPVSTPQQSAQRVSVDTPEFKRLMFAWLEAQNGAPSVAAYAALIAHINAWGSAGSGATPEGWKLVPVEPTPAMIAAMHFKGDVDIAIGHAQFYADAEEDYAAMLAAAPSPAPQGEQA